MIWFRDWEVYCKYELDDLGCGVELDMNMPLVLLIWI